MLADVSGHGLAAAMYTVYINALWHGASDFLSKPAELARHISSRLETLIGEGASFATAIFGLVDLKKYELFLRSREALRL